MKIQDRIRAIESRVLGRNNDSPSVRWELCSTFELMHLDGVINNKWQLPGSEISRIALRALEREAAGMSEAEVLARFDPIEKEIAKSFSRFPLRLGERHNASKLPC